MAATEPTLPTQVRHQRWPLSGLATTYLTLFLIVFALELPGIISGHRKDGSLAGIFSGTLVMPVALALGLVSESLLQLRSFGLHGLAAGIVSMLVGGAIMTGIIEVGVRLVRWIARRLNVRSQTKVQPDRQQAGE